WRDGDGLGMVLIEHQPHGDASLDRGLKRAEHRRRRRLLEPEVVDRDVQRPRSSVEEGGDSLRDGVGVLSAVVEKEEVERGYCAPAFGSPVCSRGSSTLTGSGLVAMSAASSGSSVSVISFRSFGQIARSASTRSWSHASRPFQYGVPK